MRSLLRFATRQPLVFVIMTTAAWMLTAGLAAYVAALLLHRSQSDNLSQSIGTLMATGCLMLVMGRWGWLRSAGVTALGSAPLWILTACLGVVLVIGYQIGFFGEVVLTSSTPWARGEAQSILWRDAVVGTVEEILFRGFVLFALVRVWSKRRRGAAAAVTVSALMFALPHFLQLLGGNPLDDTLMTILNCFIGGLWCGALVLLGGSVWPVVLIHAATNASVQIGAAALVGYSPTVLNYALTTSFELPLVFAGLWLLGRAERAARPRWMPGLAGSANSG